MRLLPSLELACSNLKGSSKRMFLGQLAIDIGYGGQSLVSKTLDVTRNTISKGIEEVKTGIAIEDKFYERGKKPLEKTHPKLIADIDKILDNASQIDPKFTSERLYTRLTASEVRRQLIKKGYSEKGLPCNQTIRNKMKSLGYKWGKVAKTKPEKK